MGFFNKLKAQAFEKAKEQMLESLGEDAAAMLGSLTGGGGGGGGHQMSKEEYENTKPDELKKDIRMSSGCHDKQTSADVSNVSSFQLPDPAGECYWMCDMIVLYVFDFRGANSEFIVIIMNITRPCWRSLYFNITQNSICR